MAKTSYTLGLLLMLSLACFVSSQDILPPLLTVTGKGEAKAQPDEVSVTVGIQLRAKSVEEVSSDTDSRSAAIIAYLQSQGVADEDIQTSYVTLQPYYSYTSSEAGQTTPDYYTSQKSITFSLKDLSAYDQIMSGLYDAGINSVSDVTFKVTDDEEYKEEARKKAVTDARAIAQIITDGLGVKLGGVYSISESSYGVIPTPPRVYYGGMAKSAAYDSVSVQSSGPSIAGGEVTTTMNVNVVFYVLNN